MRVSETTVETVQEFWDRLDARLTGQRTLAGAAQEWVSAFCEEFAESVVLARVFLTLPFAQLPAAYRDFAARAAEKNGAVPSPSTSVLSLIGTRGIRDDWCDPLRSRGHLGIPLLSADFVARIPMIARLLKQFGLPLDWIDQHDLDVVKRVLGRTAGTFYVPEARDEVNAAGEKIITAQDFVEEHGIRTVFGHGSAYFGGSILVFVAFCRERIEREAVECLAAPLHFFKSRTMALASPSTVFAGP